MISATKRRSTKAKFWSIAIDKTARDAVKPLTGTLVVVEEAKDETVEEDAVAVGVVVKKQSRVAKDKTLLERTMAVETKIKAKRTELPRHPKVRLPKEKSVGVKADAMEVVATEEIAVPGIQTLLPVNQIRIVL
jgi:hypothetical protein